MIQLSKRLNAVAELLVHGIDQLELEQPVLADIGTDHAYLPVYLVQRKSRKKSICRRCKKRCPLLHAKEHIEQYGLGEYIQTRLSDGGESFVPGESEVAVIAGMGGGLMQKILSGSPEFFERNSCVVLQPQSEIEQFRRFLTEDGWCILEEDMVLEDGKYYPMMSVTKKETAMPLDNPYRNAKDIDFLYGAYLLKEGHPVLQDYLKREAQIYRELLEKLSAISDRPEIQKRIHEVEKKAEQTERAIQEMSKRANQ